MSKPTAEYVRSILDYNPETGLFIWKHRADQDKRWNSRYAGKIAGSYSDGYVRIDINSKTYKVHQLAWLLATGNWPQQIIDHQDNDGKNNQMSNLRLATNAENNRNSKIYSNNSSGIKGLTWRKNRGHWTARITVDGKIISLGSFHDKSEALIAITEVRIKYHGAFAKVA